MSNPLLLLRLASIVLVPNSAQSRVKKSKDLGAFHWAKLGKIRILPAYLQIRRLYRFLLMLKSAQ